MGIEFPTVKTIAAGWGAPAKPCDTCKTTVAAVFCRVDSAFLCLHCDTTIHGGGSGDNNKLVSPHARVWMCEVCEQAPSSVTCKADAAALCVTCDADIHSANPLASRHERIPVEPFYDSAAAIFKSSPVNLLFPITATAADVNGGACGHEDWCLPSFNNIIDSKIEPENTTTTINHSVHVDLKPVDLMFPDIEHFIDFDYTNPFHQNNQTTVDDNIVPVQTKPATIPAISNENCYGIGFSRSDINSYSYPSQSFSQSVSSSSLDVGVVPEGNSVSDISYSFGGSMSNQTGSVHGSNQATQLSGSEREARVLRYREKRKNRKFEKTIRYASRKAYAESRPRIKGRFVKRPEMNRLYNDSGSTAVAFMMDAQYGIVPSF